MYRFLAIAAFGGMLLNTAILFYSQIMPAWSDIDTAVFYLSAVLLGLGHLSYRLLLLGRLGRRGGK